MQKTHELKIPTHIAIIMDGNGRWAQQHGKPRLVGHKAGVKALRECVENCVKSGVRYLTVFAFSSENWHRPNAEVEGIMRLFVQALKTEAKKLNKNRIELRLIGDIAGLNSKVVSSIQKTESNTINDPLLTLVVAMNYGGRWDILQAAQRLKDDGVAFTQEGLQERLLTSQYTPEPDLVIRTGGEQRISNFLLWQIAYSELYFANCLWPDFDDTHLQAAILDYTQRERRFGALTEDSKNL